MTTLIPVTQPTNVEAAYEDMFKEITRKLYGEETGNGLHTLGTPVAHVATTGPTAPEGERSFTTLMSDRSLAQTIEYDHNAGAETTTSNNFKSEDHLTTAFGLAALMQNGFPPTGAILNPQIIPKTSTNVTSTVVTSTGNNNTATNNNNSTVNTNTGAANTNEPRWATTNEEIMPWSTGGKLASFNGIQNKNSKTSKNRDLTGNDMYSNSTGTTAATNNNNNINNTQNTNSRKNKNSSNNNHNSSVNNNQMQIQKRYSCSHCPYSTDRRDLYTRHENIHKDEKPFQCYACLKQFNRADHVKKHFLRMHRELAYDINKTRRTVNTDQKPNIFAQNANNNNQQQQQMQDGFLNAQRNTTGQESSSLSIAQTIESVATAQLPQHGVQMKQEKSPDDKSSVKVKREKRFSCCYCPWSGADKWGLKRHLNTHTKPFVCMLCDYKAARSERLATHVLKVHNKKACNKCSFLADNQEEYQTHMNEIHPHDQRPSRSSNNSNVLRTIGNTLVTNNQLNNFQNPTTSFGNLQTSNSGVAIYTSNDLTSNAGNNATNGLQDIVVNPPSVVGWRLSANGSLIPPHIQGSAGEHTTNPNQKRGAERLFQYLEADGSDPEDYTRQLKMDAISRNTASVAQDFHNAGGVKVNIKTTSTTPIIKSITTSADQLLLNKENNNSMVVEDYRNDKNQQNANNNNNNNSNSSAAKLNQRKAMSSKHIIKNNNNNKQLNKSPPAYQNSTNNANNTKQHSTLKGHRLDLIQDKENSNSIFANMEYENNLKQLELQFQNYVKEIISKYYAETPLLYTNNQNGFNNPNMSTTPTTAAATISNETKNYIEYLKNKSDITLTITPKNANSSRSPSSSSSSLIFQSIHPDVQQIPLPLNSSEKRHRKQARPKKIAQHEILLSRLRDKYLKKLVDRKKSCLKCANNITNYMVFFPYHSSGSLAFHRLWKHSQKITSCPICHHKFLRNYSLKVHLKIKHHNKK